MHTNAVKKDMTLILCITTLRTATALLWCAPSLRNKDITKYPLNNYSEVVQCSGVK